MSDEPINPSNRDLKKQAVVSALLAVADANDGALSPSQVVEAARDPNSPLHGKFTWDDGEAAQAYRIIQAQGLIRSIELHIVREDRTNKVIGIEAVRQFESRPSMRKAELGYEPIQDIMTDAEKRAEMLQQAIRELMAVRKRYERLKELDKVWKAVDTVTKPPPKKKK